MSRFLVGRRGEAVGRRFTASCLNVAGPNVRVGLGKTYFFFQHASSSSLGVCGFQCGLSGVDLLHEGLSFTAGRQDDHCLFFFVLC